MKNWQKCYFKNREYERESLTIHHDGITNEQIHSYQVIIKIQLRLIQYVVIYDNNVVLYYKINI